VAGERRGNGGTAGAHTAVHAAPDTPAAVAYEVPYGY